MSYLENNAANQISPLSYKGRFGRLSYLAWTFIVSILYSCALFVVIAIGAISIANSGLGLSAEGLFSNGLGYLAVFLLVAVAIVFTALFIIITIRRLHDLNKTGWLVLLMFVPLANIGFWIYVTFFKGTQGANNFGPQRSTEQSEKYLGILYAIFLVIFVFAYAAGIVAAQKFQNASALQQIEQGYEEDVEMVTDGISEEELEVYDEEADATDASAEAIEAAEAAVAAADEIAE
jgi:uncharacterized membrane protein YhaH (DUF805 family)